MTTEPMAGTVAVRSAVPGLRLAAIGATAVLAVGVAIVTAAFLVGRPGGSLGPSAGYVPADAAMYFEVRLDLTPAQHADLEAIVSRFPGGEGALSGSLTELLGEGVEMASEASGVDYGWDENVATWFSGRIGAALLEYPATDPMAPVPASVDGLLLLGSTDDAAAREGTDNLRGLAELEGAEVSSSEYRGTTMWSVGGSSGEPMAYAVVPGQVIIGPSVASVQRGLDVAADASETFAQRQDVARQLDNLPSDWVALMAIDGASLLEGMRRDAALLGPAFESMVEGVGEATASVTVATMGLAQDRLIFSASAPVPEGATPMNSDRDLASHVPSDALLYLEAGNIGAGMTALVTAGKGTLGAMPGAPADLDEVEAAIGAEIEDFVSWIGDGAAVGGWTDGAPYAGLVLVPNDIDAATARLEQLVGFARLAAMDPGSGITVAEETVGGVEVTTISGGSSELAPMGEFAVQLAISEDLVRIGWGESFVERSLTLEPGESLDDSDRFSAAIAAQGGASNASAAYADLAGMLAAADSVIGSDMPMWDDIRPYLAPFGYAAQVTTVEDGDIITRGAIVFE